MVYLEAVVLCNSLRNEDILESALKPLKVQTEDCIPICEIIILRSVAYIWYCNISGRNL